MFPQPSVGSKEQKEEYKNIKLNESCSERFCKPPYVIRSYELCKEYYHLSQSNKFFLLEIMYFSFHKIVYSFCRNVLIFSQKVNKFFGLGIFFSILFELQIKCNL